MPSYSRRSSMPYAGDVPRITGLNSFGQPFRGRKIMGAGSDQKYIRAEQADAAEREAAAERGRQMSLRMAAAAANPTPPTPQQKKAAGIASKAMDRVKANIMARKKAKYGHPPKVRLIDGRPAQEFDPSRRYQNGSQVRPQTYAPMERMA